MLRRLSALAFAVTQMSASGGNGTLLQRANRFAPVATNPYEGQPAAEKAGAKLLQYHCSACHGRDAKGMGKAPPLVAPEVRNASPGALKWVLRNGSLTTGMPSFSKLPEEQRWQIIAYLQRLNRSPRPSSPSCN